MKKDTCDTCRFWGANCDFKGDAARSYYLKEHIYLRTVEVSNCLHHSPIDHRTWPRTRFTDWCGDYQVDPRLKDDQSDSEVVRKISEGTGGSAEAVRARIERGRHKVGQMTHRPQPSKITQKSQKINMVNLI